MVRPEEEWSATKLSAYLECEKGLSVTQERIDKDPPDFRFTVSGPNRSVSACMLEKCGRSR